MTTDAYRAASLHEIEKAMQGKRVVLVEESGGALLIGLEPWTDEAGRAHCTALRVTLFTDSDGETRLRIDYHDDRPENGQTDPAAQTVTAV